LGENRYRHDPLHYLLSTVDLPSVGQVIEASKQQSFLTILNAIARQGTPWSIQTAP
jgi:AraC-type transcriptional regulator N-terminus